MLIKPQELPLNGESLSPCDYELLQRELSEVHAQNRTLRRQLEKAIAAVAEAQRAHTKMVATLSETMRENMILTNDRDMWRNRAQRLDAGLAVESVDPLSVLDMRSLANNISEDEINAIRKAMARLHHPDVGGNSERMKAWNAALDRLCH